LHLLQDFEQGFEKFRALNRELALINLHEAPRSKHGWRMLLALYFGECQYHKGFSRDCKCAGMRGANFGREKDVGVCIFTKKYAITSVASLAIFYWATGQFLWGKWLEKRRCGVLQALKGAKFIFRVAKSGNF
jgi:hypothetical protein